MSPDEIADVAVARLGLPVPMAKLQAIHELSNALQDKSTARPIWTALLKWIASRPLESEVLEALCVVLLAKGADILHAESLRRSIERPSILSDKFLAIAFDSAILVHSWIHSHSGEVPLMVNFEAETNELTSGRVVPHILATKIKKLEARLDRPLLRQWGYEFQRLQSQVVHPYEGHYSYFSGETYGGTGTFVGTRGHLARSAYYRALALAVQAWDLPADLADDAALYATPTDFSLLKFMSAAPPVWAKDLHEITSSTGSAPQAIADGVASHLLEKTGEIPLQFNGTVMIGTTLRIDLEITSVLVRGPAVNPEDVFDFQERMLGRLVLPRHPLGEIHFPKWSPSHIYPTDAGTQLIPTVLPIVGSHIGYLQFYLIQRPSFAPANHTLNSALSIKPRIGGADVLLDGKPIGHLYYWNWRWQPMQDIGHPPAIAVCTTINPAMVSQVSAFEGYDFVTVWKVIIHKREHDYSAWQQEIEYGIVASRHPRA